MLTNYRYKKCRKIVRESGVDARVKNTFFTALRNYKNEHIVPVAHVTLSKVKDEYSGCLIGAAIFKEVEDTRDHIGSVEGRCIASSRFGLTKVEVGTIMDGFDMHSVTQDLRDVWQLARTISKELRNGRND